MNVLDGLRVPIVLAPMAGGPATVDLAVAVSEAGALGSLAAGYKTADTVERDIAGFRARSGGPFSVNVFTPPSAPADPAVYAPYQERLQPEADRAGTAVGTPRFDDDQFGAKIEVLLETRPPVVSFVFGCPASEVIGRLRDAGSFVLVTVTTPEEAAEAAGAGADGLVVQGYEAGGHRGSALGDDQPAYGLISLLQLVRAATAVPLVAAGGLSSGSGLAGALAAGAAAGQVGTAFMLCPEAGTAPVHREALASAAPTAMTRVFSGKPARGIVNRFIREHDGHAPAAYPEVHHLTAPIRAAARKSGDPDQVNLWAGQAHQLARAEPAADVVARFAREAGDALRSAAARLPQ